MRLSALLVAFAAAAGCTTSPSTQVVTGNITGSSALAVRAVSNGETITAARVRSDGSFTLSLPPGMQYELHVLTSTGVEHVLDSHSAALAFRVCAPRAPFDLGHIGHDHVPGPNGGPGCGSGGGTGGGMGSGMGGGTGGGSNGMCDPTTDPNCPPPMCDPTTDPNCPPPMCDANGNCGPCDPTTGTNCPPPMCDPMTDPSCPPPGCDPATDPTCMCDAAGNCYPSCDPTTDPMCPTPPPPCTDPTDPNTCQDPCMADPMQCGCDPSGSGTMCWPPPPPACDANGNCSGMMPDHPPGDFGC